jgi:hypothetical protein
MVETAERIAHSVKKIVDSGWWMVDGETERGRRGGTEDRRLWGYGDRKVRQHKLSSQPLILISSQPLRFAPCVF